MLALSSCAVDLVRGVVSRDGTPTPLTTREADLLRYFVAHPSVVVSRDDLLTQVWGYADTVVTRACDNTVRRLREKIEADPTAPDHVLTVHGVGYRFEPALTAMDPVAVPPSDDRPLVELGDVRIDLVRRRVFRSDGDRTLGESEAALLEALIRADGAVVDRQDLARAGWGHSRGTTRTIDTVVRQLRTKLERDPANPTWILTARGGGYRLERPSLPTVEPVRPPVARLLGRDPLVATIRTQVEQHRWVLLLGPAGIGKSSLARVVTDGRAAVVWADLATARSVDAAAALVARALGVELGAIDALVRVRTALARRPVLLVLDNLDAIASEAAVLVDACVSAGTGIRVFGTSRVRVGATDEVVIEVPPLDPTVAVALFVERARAVSSANDTIGDHAATIADIVDRLDRVPLAIELAAARTAALGPPELQQRLRLDVLVRGTGDPRHRSLRSAITTSLEGLPPRASAALRLLSLFRAGFTLDDAEALLGDEAVDTLQLLRDHSLLRTELPCQRAGTGERRGPTLLFDTWQAVHEHCADVEREAETVLRFCRCLARFGEEPSFGRLGFQGTEPVLRRMTSLVEDLTRATRLALALGAGDVAGWCVSAAAFVRTETGPYLPMLGLVDEVLATALPDPLRARLLLQRGGLAVHAGQDPAASFGAAIEVCDRCDAPVVLQAALGAMSDLRSNAGRHDEARALSARAAAVARAWAPGSGAAEGHEARIALFDGDEVGQVRWLEQGVDLARRSGDSLRLVELLRALGDRYMFVGDFPLARARLEEARERSDTLGMSRQLTHTTLSLLSLLIVAGDVREAARWAPVSRDLGTRLGSRKLLYIVLHQVARSHLLSGELAAAASALAEADTLESTPLLQAHCEESRAELALASGDPEAARVRALDAADRFRHLSMTENAALLDSRAALACVWLGDLVSARELGDRAQRGVADADRSRRRTSVACALALVARAEGRPEVASGWFEQVRSRSAGFVDGETERDLVRIWVGPWAVGLLDGGT